MFLPKWGVACFILATLTDVSCIQLASLGLGDKRTGVDALTVTIIIIERGSNSVHAQQIVDMVILKRSVSHCQIFHIPDT